MKITPPSPTQGPNKSKSPLDPARLPNHWKIILVLIVILFGYGLVFLGTARAETLNVSCYKDYRPYSYLNEKGQVEGILIDFWRLWAQKNKVELQFIPDHLGQSIERVKSGEADFMIGLFHSTKRGEFMDFSNSILDVETNLYIRQDMEISKLEELGETPVGVIQDDYVTSFLSEHHPDVKMKYFKGSEAVVKNALAGRLSAYALDFPNAIFLLAEHDALTRFKIFKTLYKGKLRAGVAKGNAQLLTRINHGIKSVTKEEIQELSYKWGLIPQPLIVQYRGWVITAIVLLLGGCIGFGIYIFRLKSRLVRVKENNQPFNKEKWLALIREGETDAVEFKSSLRWNIKTEKADPAVEAAIIKTLAAFMNTRGGHLFIGVNDDGRLLGLDADYQTFQNKKDRDGFMLKLASLINNQMGRHSHEFISTQIQNIDGLDVCCIQVRPGTGPVFVKFRNQESFYIRAGASSPSLSMSESHEYIRSRW